MSSPSFVRRSHLPRLPSEYYRGHAVVHWTMTIDHRETGWLNPCFHDRFCLLLLHALARHQLVCPAYCLMPDHLHLIWAGLSCASDQRLASAFFRRHLNRLLSPWSLQAQAYDHVLRSHERTADVLASTIGYIMENPVRAGLCEVWQDYTYANALIAGYPDLDIRQKDFGRIFWHVFGKLAVPD